MLSLLACNRCSLCSGVSFLLSGALIGVDVHAAVDFHVVLLARSLVFLKLLLLFEATDDAMADDVWISCHTLLSRASFHSILGCVFYNFFACMLLTMYHPLLPALCLSTLCREKNRMTTNMERLRFLHSLFPILNELKKDEGVFFEHFYCSTS